MSTFEDEDEQNFKKNLLNIYVNTYAENFCKKHISLKLKFREMEKVALKICQLNSRLSFNETCLK